MMVRARDDIYRMSDLKGKKIGITKSLNTIKNDWWRIQEHQQILLMLRMNGMTERDITLVDFPYPDCTLQVANIPAVITCTDTMAEKHPELAVAFLKGMIRAGRWANDHKQAASVILNKQTYYLDEADTYRGIKDVDMVPNLSPQNLACVDIGKDFMLKKGYIRNNFDVQKWAAPEFLEQAAKELLEEKWRKIEIEKLPRPDSRLG